MCLQQTPTRCRAGRQPLSSVRLMRCSYMLEMSPQGLFHAYIVEGGCPGHLCNIYSSVGLECARIGFGFQRLVIPGLDYQYQAFCMGSCCGVSQCTGPASLLHFFFFLVIFVSVLRSFLFFSCYFCFGFAFEHLIKYCCPLAFVFGFRVEKSFFLFQKFFKSFFFFFQKAF